MKRFIERSHHHGMSKTPEYRIWAAMINRCSNSGCSSFKNYGGRGIKVCDRWRMSFLSFIEDIGFRPSNKHSIERIDNNLDYCKENCKWATKKDQSANRRTARMITAFGVTKSMTEWSEHTGIPCPTIYRRIKDGIDPSVALSLKKISRRWWKKP